MDGGQASYSAQHNPTQLGLFLYPEAGTHGHRVSSDLANLLLDFVPELEQVPIKTLPPPPKEEGKCLRETEAEALNEVLLLLRLACCSMKADTLNYTIPTGQRVPSFNLNSTEPSSGNGVPVSSAVVTASGIATFRPAM